MPQQTFSNIEPIQQAQTFSNVTPIDAGQPASSDLYQQARQAYDKAHGKVGNPGASEGAGLRGGLSDWDEASFGEIGGGVKDILQGNIAKGFHRIITGGASALTPAAPLAAAAAPATFATSAGAGLVGGKLTRAAAEHLGASQDQADLAEDIGSIATATGTAKAISSIPTSLRTAPVRLAARAAETAANQKAIPIKPLLNIMSPADEAEVLKLKIPGRDYGLTQTEAPLDATGENKPFAGERSPAATPPAPGVEPPAPRIPAKQLPPIPGVNVPPSVGRIQPVIPTEPPAPANPDYVPFRPSIERIIDEVKNEPGFKNISRADLDARFSKALAEVQAEAAQAPQAQPQDLTGKLQQTLDQLKARGKQMAPRVPKESMEDFNARLAKIADAKKAARSLEDLQ